MINFDKIKNLISQALLQCNQDFTLHNARSYLNAALNEINKVIEKKERNKKLVEAENKNRKDKETQRQLFIKKQSEIEDNP